MDCLKVAPPLNWTEEAAGAAAAGEQQGAVVKAAVRHQRRGLREPLPALPADVRLLPGVEPGVPVQVGHVAEATAALGAAVPPYTVVGVSVVL